MVGAKSTRRGIGGLLAALVLVMLACGPTVDAFVCRGEAPIVVGTVAEAAHAAQQTGHADHHDQGQPCAHGHCHHAGLFAAAPTAEVKTVQVVAVRPVAHWASVALSDAQFGLMRPPRA